MRVYAVHDRKGVVSALVCCEDDAAPPLLAGEAVELVSEVSAEEVGLDRLDLASPDAERDIPPLLSRCRIEWRLARRD